MSATPSFSKEEIHTVFSELNDKGECVEVTLYTKYGAFCFAGLYIGMEVMARESPLVHGARNTYLSVGVAEN